MKIGIIAAMAEELALLLEHLEETSRHQVLGQVYYEGQYQGCDVVLVQSGIGKVMSALSVAILGDHFQVDAIINTGSAGALASGLAISDVVIADQLAYHDVDLTAFDYAYGQMAGQPHYFKSDTQLVADFQQALKNSGQTFQTGLIVTGDSFVAGQEETDRIASHYPKALAVEMEGAAIAQAAHTAQLPFIVIRAISDTADQDANITFDQFLKEAGKRSAQVLLHFLAGKSS